MPVALDPLVHLVGEQLAGWHPNDPPILAAAASLVVRAHRGDRQARAELAELAGRSEQLRDLFGHAHRILTNDPEARALLASSSSSSSTGGPHHGGHGHGGHHGHHGGRRGGGGMGGVVWDAPTYWPEPEIVIVSADPGAQDDAEELAEALTVAGAAPQGYRAAWGGFSFPVSPLDRFAERAHNRWSGPTGAGVRLLQTTRRELSRTRTPADDEAELER